ncbi:conserved Plasmodium protein, unknown function [Plasmodium gallinaceum]|uniref:Uncharacterized protein n=1 Tax=Plasmodium gallinaceum TaxID=5849 RepID=A0A1J1GLD8_PLAGA|nr:conserved Plasmodium protein, unknown function [Plasmodium gallinaceum]CRG93222.1 conserved Plasmodium protein, unknown function [Plasmodium gallinaceum]
MNFHIYFFKTFARFLCIKNETPYFFKNGSRILINEKKSYNINYVEKENNKYTLINNIHYIKESDFFNRLIKIYIDIIFNFSKYPLHVQCLHIFCKKILKEKIENVKSSLEHKKVLYNSDNIKFENLNEYLVNLNKESIEKKESEEYFNKVFEKVKKFYYYKNVLYALFTLEHNKIIFNYTENLLIKDLQNCLINSTLNNSKDIYRFIKKNGQDNIYIYIIEFSDNLYILKKRYNFIKYLFYNNMQNKL